MPYRIHTALRLNAVAVALAAATLAAPTAHAQLAADLPCKVANFTPQEEQSVQEFAREALARLGSDDTVAVERARRELATPLRRGCVSVAFRQLLRRESISSLTTLAGDANEIIAINALNIAGELAEPAAFQLLLQHVTDDRVAIRLAAVSGLKSSLRAISRTAPAINSAQVVDMARTLGARLDAEPNPYVLDGIVLTLLQANLITRPEFEEARVAALSEVANRQVARLRKAPEADLGIMKVTALKITEHLSRRLAAAGSVPPQTCRDAAAFTGELLASIAHAAGDGSLGGNRRAEIDIVNLCERTLAFGHTKLGGGSPSPATGLSALLESGEDREFLRRVQETVLRLEAAPFNLSKPQMDRMRDALQNG